VLKADYLESLVFGRNIQEEAGLVTNVLETEDGHTVENTGTRAWLRENKRPS
jgi:hypothetical protein